MSDLIAHLRDIHGSQMQRPLLIDIWPATPFAGSLAFAALDAATLARLQPDLVVFALFGPPLFGPPLYGPALFGPALFGPAQTNAAEQGPPQDAIAVIERLLALGYAGRMVVICPTLPAPKLVEAELRSAGTGGGPGPRLTLLIWQPAQAPGLSAR